MTRSAPITAHLGTRKSIAIDISMILEPIVPNAVFKIHKLVQGSSFQLVFVVNLIT